MSDQLLARAGCRMPSDRYVCASLVRALAERHGLAHDAAAALGLAAAELASNAIEHGHGGELELWWRSEPRAAIEIVCRDAGPGIPDVQAALRDGFSRGRVLAPQDSRELGLGTGLGSVVRATDVLRIETSANGTIVRASRWIR